MQALKSVCSKLFHTGNSTKGNRSGTGPLPQNLGYVTFSYQGRIFFYIDEKNSKGNDVRLAPFNHLSLKYFVNFENDSIDFAPSRVVAVDLKNGSVEVSPEMMELFGKTNTVWNASMDGAFIEGCKDSKGKLKQKYDFPEHVRRLTVQGELSPQVTEVAQDLIMEDLVRFAGKCLEDYETRQGNS